MGKTKRDQLLGKVDLLVLRILACGDSMHGYAIAERIEQLSENVLQVGEGSLYPALHRMDESGWIRSEWAASDNNRRARYYRITAAGRRQLAEEESAWLLAADAVTRVLRLANGQAGKWTLCCLAFCGKVGTRVERKHIEKEGKVTVRRRARELFRRFDHSHAQ